MLLQRGLILASQKLNISLSADLRDIINARVSYVSLL